MDKNQNKEIMIIGKIKVISINPRKQEKTEVIGQDLIKFSDEFCYLGNNQNRLTNTSLYDSSTSQVIDMTLWKIYF